MNTAVEKSPAPSALDVHKENARKVYILVGAFALGFATILGVILYF